MRALELSSEEFRRLAGDVADFCAQFLSNLDGRPIHPVTSGAET